MTAMQWDSGTDALGEIDAALQSIADAEATMKLVADMKAKLDEQARAARELKQRGIARRDRAMNAALNGKVDPEVVATRAEMKPTAMYQAIARTTGKRVSGRRMGGS